MEGLIMGAQLILGLSILVGLHELGHLLTAKLFGMRVEQYYIGFPPKITGFRYGETEYNLGMVPLGGFVKISGMVDESLDTAKLNEEPEPWEFRAKPAWQRLIVMMGGIIVNVITGIIIFIVLNFAYGDTYVPREEVLENGIAAYDLGQEIGLQTGDKVLEVNGQPYQKLNDLYGADVLLENESYYTVERSGETLEVPVPRGFLDKFSKRDAANNFIDVRRPFKVGPVSPGSPADEGGLQEGDRIVSINGQPIKYFDEFEKVKKENTGKVVDLAVIRSGDNVEESVVGTPVDLQVEVGEDGVMGFQANSILDLAHTDYTFSESVPKGAYDAFDVVWRNIQGLGKIFSGDVSASNAVSGPIGIAQIFGGTWDWQRFWFVTGLLSMVLAFMNFLPIPALDGGHVVFLTYEMVSGRKPSDKFLEGAQKVGMVLLLSLMVFAVFNDIFKTFF